MSDLCPCLASVCLSLPPFLLRTGCRQQSTQMLHHDQAPRNPLPVPRPQPGSRANTSRSEARSLGGGRAASAQNIPALPSGKPKGKFKREPYLLTRFAGQSWSVSASPQHLTVLLPLSCEAVAGSESTWWPLGWKGGVLICLCPLSVSKAHAIHRNNIFIHLHDFFFFAFYGVYRDEKFSISNFFYYLGGIMCHKTVGQVCDPTCSKYIKIVIYPPKP